MLNLNAGDTRVFLFHSGDAELDPTAANNPGYYVVVARWDGSYELDFAPGDVPNLVVKNQVNAFGLVAAQEMVRELAAESAQL